MNPASIARAAVLTLGLVFAAGCAKGTSATNPGTTFGTTADLTAAIKAAYVPGSVLPTTIDTTASLIASMDVAGLKAGAALFFANGSLVDAGTVTARTDVLIGSGTTETALAKLAVNVSGHPEYVYTSLANHPAGINLPFDGTAYQRFTVTGTSAFPAFVDSVRSVPLPVVVTPAADAVVARSGTLSVTWSDAFTDTTVYVQCAVRSLADTSKLALGELVRNDAGATIVTSAKLQTLPAGAARLSVSRYRLDYHNYGGHKTGLAVEATVLRSLTLN